MSIAGSLATGAAGLGMATVAFAGVGVATGLASGSLASLHKHKDGRSDVAFPLKATAASVGAMAIGGTLLAVAGTFEGRGGAVGALRGVGSVIGGAALLAGGFTTMLGGVGTGIALAD